jgi:NADPH:quinone reductase
MGGIDVKHNNPVTPGLHPTPAIDGCAQWSRLQPAEWLLPASLQRKTPHMRCVICPRYGGPEVLEVQQRPSRAVGAGEVRVAIKAAGVNFPDALLIAGTYQIKLPPPFVPGLEAAGVIVECGQDVGTLKPGDNVIIDGSSEPHGLFADEAVVPAKLVALMPKGLNFAEAAATPVVYGTSYHALVQRGHIAAGEVLLVHGAAGGVGLSAMQIGTALGARVIGTVGDDAKRQALLDLGFKDVVNYRSEDIRSRVLDLTGGNGADVIYDPIGGEVFDASVRCVAKEGRILVIGFTSGVFPTVPANRLLIKEASVVGVLYGAWKARHPEQALANLRALTEMYETGSVRPRIWKTFPFSAAGDAVAALTARHVVGKIVLTPD